MRKFLLILALLVLLERALGLVLVWFEVRPIIVVLHFVVVLLMVGWISWSAAGAKRSGTGVKGGSVEIVVVFVFSSLFLGAWTSAHIGAPEACQGFPLCNGALLPSHEHLVRMHWSHRIASYATLFVVYFYAIRAWRRKRDPLVRKSAAATAALVTLQSVAGAALVLDQLPRWLRGMHLALAVALWAVVVVWWRSSRTRYSS